MKNLGAISWMDHVLGRRKVKHVGIKYHYVRQSVAERLTTVVHMPLSDNRADSLSNGLIRDTFESHCNWLSVRDIGRIQ